MTEIQLKTSGASLTAKATGKITSGTVGMPVIIEYDDSWDGLTKTAMFRVSEFSRKRENIGTYTTVPWEVLRIPGQRLDIGIEGRDASGEVVVPTVWASVGTVLRGANSDIPAAPNPDSGETPAGGGDVIDDSEVSLSKTWSSQKISDEINANAGTVGGVSSVNGISPDENGNVDIDTECQKVFFEDDDYNDLIEVGDFVVDKDRGTLSVCVQIDVETGLNPARFVGLQEVGVGFAIKTVNGIEPDENGNVEIEVGGGSAEGAVLINQGQEKAGTLLYVGSDGNVANAVVGDGLDVVYGHGKNIARAEWANGYWSPTGWNESTGVSNCGLREKVPVVPGGTYTASFVKFGNISENYIFIYIYEYNQDGNYLVENTQVKGLYFRPTSPKTFTVGVNTAYIGVRLYLSGAASENIIPEGFMIEEGSVATEYEPYTEGYTITAQKQTAESITDLAYAEHAPSMAVRSIAHRGVTKDAPDCTAPAYILARKMGFRIAENDVACTVDGKYVMWHDTTLAKCTIVYSLDGKQLYSDASGNRYWVSASSVYTYDEATGEYTLTDVAVSTLTRVNGNTLTVSEQTYGFLRNIDVGGWKSGKYTGTQMLSFEEWIELCKMLGMECYVDSKFQYTVDQAAELVAIARKKGMLRKCSWLASSMADGTPLANIRLADPKARCGMLNAPTENKFVENGAFDKALKAGGEGSVFWNPRNTDVTAENVELTLSYGYGYESWYVGTAGLSEEVYYAEIERLLKCGCQGLTLDDHTVENFIAYKYGNEMKKY